MSKVEHEDGYLEGRLLVAMPTMSDARFERSVILVCSHSESGAMGLVINKAFEELTFTDLLSQLNIEDRGGHEQIRVHFGGPVETGRGFVLHSTDVMQDGSLIVGGDVALTATVDMLKAIAAGDGPSQRLLALGYAGWAPGQLETEIQTNGWLIVDPDPDLIFGSRLDQKWQQAVAKLGIDVSLLSMDAGHA